MDDGIPGHAKTGAGLLVWFDTEYTDLDLDRARLLQVAAIVTDGDLRRVLPPERDIRWAIRLDPDAPLSPWVRQNLADIVETCGGPDAVEAGEADRRLAGLVAEVAGPPAPKPGDRPVLAGNSIHADWWIARRFLPRFLASLHYRHLDVSSFKLEWLRRHPDVALDKENPREVARWFPGAALPAGGRHDALYDVQASIAEMAFYRANLLRE